MTLKEKYRLVNMAPLPISETLAFSIELAKESEHIFIGITNGNSLLAYDAGKPTYNQLYDIAKSPDKILAENIYKTLIENEYLSSKHIIDQRSSFGLVEGTTYTVFMLCFLK
jgi:hypothetical protein